MSEYDQSNLDLSTETPSGPVECLGQTFESDDARREHYTELLREKLKDPEFRKIEGFPIGEDEDILALSDPPYYTACPNPWIEDFVKHHGRPYDPDEKYHREPFVADVSEGKNDPIYQAHSYHTKVPYKALQKFISHYSIEGDIIADLFCGTGMTGFAAATLGRKAILSDLSPYAGFISQNYSKVIPPEVFWSSWMSVLNNTKKDNDWLYRYEVSNVLGELHYAVWSDHYYCEVCSANFKMWDALVGEFDKIKEIKTCPNCSVEISKKTARKIITGEGFCKSSIVKIYETRNGAKIKRDPCSKDYEVANECELKANNYRFPDDLMLFKGGRFGDMYVPKQHTGLNQVNQFYLPRAVIAVSEIYKNILKIEDKEVREYLIWAFLSVQNYINKKQSYFGGGGGQPGTLTISDIIQEKNVFEVLNRKMKKIYNLIPTLNDNIKGKHSNINSCHSATCCKLIPSNSIDYIFIDPPFGRNLMYSELNFINESWLRVFTNQKPEAIINKSQFKKLPEYRNLMQASFAEAFRILKPSRWVTVEFSNTKASIWNSIQSSLTEAGFVIANVSALDKQQGSFKAVTTPTAVKQDLVISAYKPSKQLELIFSGKSDRVEGLWDFVDLHLKQLPVCKLKGGSLEFVAERDPRILYDRMVAFYISHNTPVPLSSSEFQSLLEEKYPCRSGMVFLHEQVAEYDKVSAKVEKIEQLEVFVEDEKSAINWLRAFLKDKPSSRQNIHPEFTQVLLSSWKKFETQPELDVLLDQNFLKYSGEGDVPSQIHGYLSTDYHGLRKLEKDDPKLKAKAKDRWYVPDPKKMVDVEAQREKKLLAEFWGYAAQAGMIRGQTQTSQASLPLGDSAKKKPKVKKLKEVRTDAVRAGFMECQRNNQGSVILAVAEILPANVIEEDEQLQMIYDMAEMRAG